MMNNRAPLLPWLAIGFCLFAGPFGQAASRIDPELRAAIAARTVVVYNPFFGDFKTTTTGFVWGYKDKVSYVLTAVGSERIVRELPSATVVIFPGTKREKKCSGKVVLYDRDLKLAVIAVKAPELPPPFAFHSSPLKTGTRLYVASCPRPEVQQIKEVYKRAKVASSSLGATRKSRRLELLQLNGTIPEGGEGGPVVLGNGKLVGIARMQVGITLISGALPISYTQRFLSGMPSVPMVSQYRKELNNDTLAIAVPLLDLQSKVQACSLHVVPKADVPAPVAPADGTWQLLHQTMTTFELPATHPTCNWERPTTTCGLLLGDYWVQARTTVPGGGQFVSPPAELRIQAPTKPQIVNKPKPVPKPRTTPVPAAPVKTVRSPSHINSVPFTGFPVTSPLRIKRAFAQQLGAYSLTPFQIGTQGKGEFRELQKVLSADALWAEDGNALYLFHAMNIRRIAFPEGTETARAQVGAPVRLCLARQGLVAVVHNLGLLLLDPETLALKKRLSVPGIADLLVAPQGRYAIGISGSPNRAKPYEPFSVNGKETLIGGLHIVDLDSWRQMHTYRSRTTPLPVIPANAELVDHAMATPAALTSDGNHFVVAGRHGSELMTMVYPFRGGKLVLPGVGSVRGGVERLIPRPNSGTVLVASSWRTWTRRVPRPKGAPPQGSRIVQSLDPSNPTAKHPQHWAWEIGVTRDQLFLYTAQSDPLRVLASDGTEGPPITLPRTKGGLSQALRAILPAPMGNRTILLGASAAYLLEPPAGRPDKVPPAAVTAPDEEAEPPKEDTVTGKALAPTRRVIGGMECQSVKTHPGHYQPMLRTNAAGDTAYLVDQTGILMRIDLAGMVETHRVDEKAITTGLCLTRAGLVSAISTAGAAELRLRDPGTLQIRKRWPLPGIVTALISRPTTDAILMRNQQEQLVLFDCASGRVAQSYARLPLPADAPPRARITGYPAPVMSKDGTVVFAVQDRRLLRLRIGNGELLPEAVSREPVGRAKCVAVDDDLNYVGIITLDFAHTLRGSGWGPNLRIRPSAEKKVHDGIVVLDATSLVPLYQGDIAGVARFGFDSTQSQLVTERGTRCFPDGSFIQAAGQAEGQARVSLKSRLGYPFPPLERSRDGWFIRPEPNGFCRFRFPTMAVSTRSLLRGARR